MLRKKETAKPPAGIDGPLTQSEEAEAAAIEQRELALIAARAEARVTCLHLHRMDKVLAALTTSITDCAQRALAATDDNWAMAHKAMLDDLVRDYLDVVRPSQG